MTGKNQSNQEVLDSLKIEIDAIVDNPDTGYLRNAREEVTRYGIGATQEFARNHAIAMVICDLNILNNTVTAPA